MAVDLDAIDRRIVVLLEEDGRMPSSEIARRIGGVSERAVRYRVERLRSSGVLRITALLDPVALGYSTIGEVLVDVAPNRLQDVAAELVKIDQVAYVAGTLGDGNLNAQIYARDNEQLVRIVDEVIGSIPGVVRVRTMIVPRIFKDPCDWRVPAESAERGAPMT